MRRRRSGSADSYRDRTGALRFRTQEAADRFFASVEALLEVEREELRLDAEWEAAGCPSERERNARGGWATIESVIARALVLGIVAALLERMVQ